MFRELKHYFFKAQNKKAFGNLKNDSINEKWKDDFKGISEKIKAKGQKSRKEKFDS